MCKELFAPPWVWGWGVWEGCGFLLSRRCWDFHRLSPVVVITSSLFIFKGAHFPCLCQPAPLPSHACRTPWWCSDPPKLLSREKT